MSNEWGTIKSEIVSLLGENRLKEAETLLTDYKLVNRNDKDSYMLEAMICIENEAVDKAIACLQQGMRVFYDDFDLLYNLASLYDAQRNVFKAIYFFEAAAYYTKSKEQLEEIRKRIAVMEEATTYEYVPEKILFLQEDFTERAYGIAKTLKDKKCKVYTIVIKSTTQSAYSDLYDEVFNIQNVDDIVRFINKNQYDIVYSVNMPNYLSVLATITNKPVIHDSKYLKKDNRQISIEDLLLEYCSNVQCAGMVYISEDDKCFAARKFRLNSSPTFVLSDQNNLTENFSKDFFEFIRCVRRFFYCKLSDKEFGYDKYFSVARHLIDFDKSQNNKNYNITVEQSLEQLKEVYVKRDYKQAKHILNHTFPANSVDPRFLYWNSMILEKEGKTQAAIYNYAFAQMLSPAKIEFPQDRLLRKAKTTSILLGPSEIANQLNLYSKALRKKGYRATNFGYWRKNFQYELDEFFDLASISDPTQQILTSKKIAAEKISQYDIFHYIYGRSMALDYSDLPLYQQLNKKICMTFVGDDIRLYSQSIKKNHYLELIKDDYFGKLGLLDEKPKIQLINYLGKYIRHCFVDIEYYEFAKKHFENVHLIRSAVDLNNFPMAKKCINKRPIIVHAPSNPVIKGTKYILNAIESLKKKYDFDFILVENKPFDEAKKIYESADIFIDQLILGTYGGVAVEAMALGKPVISWIADYRKEYDPKDMPVVSANPDNIQEKIESLLKDTEMRNDLGIKSRRFVEKYHDVNKIINGILQVYNEV